MASAAPINDNFASAQAITGTTGNVAGSNVDTTGEPGEPDHNEFSQLNFLASVWYTLTAPASGGMRFSATNDGRFHHTVAVYSGDSYATLDKIASDSQSNSVPNDEPAFFTAQASTTYRICVSTYAEASHSFTLTWKPVALPVITSPLVVRAEINQPFRYQLTATEHPTSFEAFILVPRLDLDCATGIISDTPTGTGTYSWRRSVPLSELLLP